MVRQIRPPPTVPPFMPVLHGFPNDPTLEPVNVQAALLAIYDYSNRLHDWAQLGLDEQRVQAADILGKAGAVHEHAATDITSLTFADARVAESNVTQHEAAINHDALDNHVAGQHRIINDVGTSATELWSASKVNTEVAAKPDDFTDLDDTPANYTSGSLKYVRVNSGETALEYQTFPTLVESYEDLDDVTAFSGNGGELVKLNAAADTLEFAGIVAGSGLFVLTEISKPSAPSAGERQLYAKSDGIYMQNSSGVETALGTDP